MKITAIELSADEQTAITNELTKRFNTEDKRQTVEFDLYEAGEPISFLGECLSCEAVLELYTEYPDFDENHQTAISYRSVVKFRITFFYDGEEIKVNDEPIYTAIEKYYEI